MQMAAHVSVQSVMVVLLLARHSQPIEVVDVVRQHLDTAPMVMVLVGKVGDINLVGQVVNMPDMVTKVADRGVVIMQVENTRHVKK